VDFETTIDGRLRLLPEAVDLHAAGALNEVRTMSCWTTVDGRLVRSVIEFDGGFIVVELDGRERRWLTMTPMR
jgi:hypothetical protein